MLSHSPKINLVPSKILELIRLQLKQAHDSEDPEVTLIFCNFADWLLTSLKTVVKRPSRLKSSSRTVHGDGSEQETLLFQEIASAYLDHANLMVDLGYADMAQKSRSRADKWGGPGIKKDDSLSSKKINRVLDIATVSESIFPDDIRPPDLPWTFPEPDSRVADTPQLVSCLSLLNQGSEGFTEDALEPATRKWLQETEKNEEEKTRLKTLATDLIRAFTRDEIKDKKAIAEVLCLASVLSEDDFRFLLGQFVQTIEGSRILDIGALNGLAQLMQSVSSPSHLHAQDLIDILSLISARLQDTHKQSPDHIFELTVSVSSVLDAMTDTKVSGLNREKLHAPLLAFLGGLQGSNDLHLRYYASYAFQALLCVPDNESLWQATVRRTTKVVKGISGLVSAVKGLDLSGFLDGLQNIQQGLEGVEQVFKLAKTTYEGVSAVYEGEQDLISALKEGLTFNRKRAWYSALRGADTLIDGGELAKFKILVCEAVCRRELAFQWGVCQRLANVAANPLWDIETRQGAVRFLEEIYRNDIVWGQLPPIKTYILDILKCLSLVHDDLGAVLLLNKLATDGDVAKQDIYRACVSAESSAHLLKSGLPELGSPSLLDRIQRRTDVEADLRRIARLRIKERGGTVYVPPLAKADLQASDKTFPLMPKVDAFLTSNDKVLLVLGDSGAGKTTFNRELDLKMWNAYQPKISRIPLFISLPAIGRPEKDLIAKHLRICEFTEPQIRELKDREFLIICDGYDESQLTHNLYESNGLNTDGGWKAQMVVSCRSEHLGQDYRDLFQPQKSNPSDPALFQMAVLVPFSMEQVKEYITQYVSIERPLWAASEYEEVLDQIPSLLDLIKNPFLLTLSLEVLPRIADPSQKLVSSKITRVLLYDEFVVQWLERNKKRLAAQDLSDPERRAFQSLSDDGFTQQGLVYLKDLSAAIYKEQEGNPVVDYSKARDAGTWKERFFGRHDEEIQLIRRVIPMTRNGGRFGFIHRSILEYGVSRAIYEPQNRVGLSAGAGEDNKRRNSIDSAFSFQLDDVGDQTTAHYTVQGPNPDSLLAKKSFIKDASVLQFLVERVEQEPVFKNQLLDYIESSKGDKKWRTAAANAITILVRAGVRFNGADLKGIRIPRADLSGGQFDCAQLEGADLRQIASGSYDSTVRLWDAQTGAPGPICTGHTGSVQCVVYSPCGQQIAFGSTDNTVQLWDMQTGAPGRILNGHTKYVTSVVYSPSGHQIASGSKDNTVRLWDAQTGAPSPVLTGHARGVSSVVYSGSILTGHTGTVNSVVYSPSGLQIASGSSDGTERGVFSQWSSDCIGQ
ncbi:hypothetical protein BGZ83_009996 [Gryganskiella cystojenkinii]|nr:hypothetical protein BGZ83_009996 [Gryganskiella cystojenkinii]